MKEEDRPIQLAEQIIQGKELSREFWVPVDPMWGQLFGYRIGSYLQELRDSLPSANEEQQAHLNWMLHPENLLVGLERKFNEPSPVDGVLGASLSEKEVIGLGGVMYEHVLTLQKTDFVQHPLNRLALVYELGGLIIFMNVFAEFSGRPMADRPILVDKIKELLNS